MKTVVNKGETKINTGNAKFPILTMESFLLCKEDQSSRKNAVSTPISQKLIGRVKTKQQIQKLHGPGAKETVTIETKPFQNNTLAAGQRLTRA